MNCVFCARLSAGEYDGEIDRLGVFHFEPLNPVTPGHRLFVPREHVPRSIYSPGITGVVFNAAVLWAADQTTDFNLIINDGPVASQTIRHLHVHYVPRREGDGLILPWTNQARP